MREELIEKILTFRRERNWEQFNNPKDLAISLSLEASELLETFQWKSSDEAVALKKEEMASELADILIYAVYLAHDLDLDIEEIVLAKLQKNAVKYPIAKAFGKKDKYTNL